MHVLCSESTNNDNHDTRVLGAIDDIDMFLMQKALTIFSWRIRLTHYRSDSKSDSISDDLMTTYDDERLAIEMATGLMKHCKRRRSISVRTEIWLLCDGQTRVEHILFCMLGLILDL